MTDEINNALKTDKVIDITTVGRKSGKDHRIEIWFHNIDGDIYITGSPGPRSWYANMIANGDFIFHLKQSTVADLKAHATPVKDHNAKRPILEQMFPSFREIGMDPQIDEWLEKSPLVKVDFVDA